MVHFYLNSRISKKGYQAIVAKYSFKPLQRTFTYSPGLSVRKQDWLEKKQKASERTEAGLQDLNKRLEKIKVIFPQAVERLATKSRDFNNLEVKRVIEELLFNIPVDDPDPDLIGYWGKWLDNPIVLKKGDGKYQTGRPEGRTMSAIKASYHSLNCFKQYCIRERITISFEFQDLDQGFYNTIMKYLSGPDPDAKRDSGYATNTKGKIIKDIKSICRKAENDGIKVNSAYRNFRVEKAKSYSVFLNEKEVDDLASLQLTGPQDRARDLFLIGCYTGLRISDIRIIVPGMFQVRDGRKFLTIHQSKTGGLVWIPLKSAAVELFKKYQNYPPHKPGDRSRNAMTSQKAAFYIREILRDNPWLWTAVAYNQRDKKVLVREAIKFHDSRRTFCTTAYEAGLPVKTIMAISGHKTEAAFMKYLGERAYDPVKYVEHEFFS